MKSVATDKVFAGSIPDIYDRFMVPLIFEPYAADLARRVASRQPARVLEVAAGTGVATRAMAATLAQGTSIMATDLNQPMLDRAAAVGAGQTVQWRQADAMQLPFDDAQFDAVVCQFGVMFFPDKAGALAQARRVLAPGGALLFNVWDAIEHNEFADDVERTLAGLFPADPPRFMSRTPHGYCDRETIARDLRLAGFTAAPRFETVASRSRAPSAQWAAQAYCQGTPLHNEIEARSPGGLARATEACAEQIARRFGTGAVDGRIQAHVVVIEA